MKYSSGISPQIRSFPVKYCSWWNIPSEFHPRYGRSSLPCTFHYRASRVNFAHQMFFVIPDTVVLSLPYTFHYRASRASGFNGFNGFVDSLRSSIVIYISLIWFASLIKCFFIIGFNGFNGLLFFALRKTGCLICLPCREARPYQGWCLFYC